MLSSRIVPSGTAPSDIYAPGTDTPPIDLSPAGPDPCPSPPPPSTPVPSIWDPVWPGDPYTAATPQFPVSSTE